MNTMEDEWERYLASFDVPNRDGDPRRHAFYMGALMMAIKCNVGTRHEIQELANDIDRYMDGCPCPTCVARRDAGELPRFSLLELVKTNQREVGHA
jgi:hypothetical protein